MNLEDSPASQLAVNTPRVAVITGGASGIGEATCYELAQRGHHVAVLDIDGQAASHVADRIDGSGTPAFGLGVDVTNQVALRQAFSRVRAELGPVGILVTSAGKVGFGKFETLSAADWHEMIDINLNGTFYCCQAGITDMIAQRWGRIVMISSSSAQRGSPYVAHYAAAKGAVITLTKSLASEFARKGITVNNIPPSSIATPMSAQSQNDGQLDSPAGLAKRVPMGRMGTPAEIAAAVGFLSSEEASFITGQVLGVNGGAVMP